MGAARAQIWWRSGVAGTAVANRGAVLWGEDVGATITFQGFQGGTGTPSATLGRRFLQRQNGASRPLFSFLGCPLFSSTALRLGCLSRVEDASLGITSTVRIAAQRRGTSRVGDMYSVQARLRARASTISFIYRSMGLPMTITNYSTSKFSTPHSAPNCSSVATEIRLIEPLLCWPPLHLSCSYEPNSICKWW